MSTLYKSLPQSLDFTLDEDGLVDAADKASLFLLDHCDEEKPIDSALAAICKHRGYSIGPNNALQDLSQNVLHNLLTLVMTRPNTYITTIFDAFYPRMSSFKLALNLGMKNYSANLGLSIAANLKLLKSERLKRACVLYGAYPSDVLIESIATDDPELFNLVCATPEGGAYTYNKWLALARFEDDPESRIAKECLPLLGVRACDEIYKARAGLLRTQFETSSSADTYLSRNPAGAGASLFVGGHNTWVHRSDDADTFYRRSTFREWIKSNPIDAIKAVYWPSLSLQICGAEQWEAADEITRIFIESGIPPGELITYGPLNRGKLGLQVQLDEALNYLGHLDDMGFRFYVYFYLTYLRTFTIEQIIEACDGSERSLMGAHKVLRDHRLLEAMNEVGRSDVFAADLGL